MSESAARGGLEDALRRLETMPAFLDRALAAADSDALLFSPQAGWFCLVEHDDEHRRQIGELEAALEEEL